MRRSRKVRAGIVGLGIGRAHLEGYQKTGRAKVAALCDIDKKRLRERAERYGIEQTYTDYEEMCRQEDLDAVSVCTPNALHVPVAVCALENGKHVLCEKPLSVSAKEGAKVLAAAGASGKKAMMGMTHRFSVDASFLKKSIEAGDLGEVYYGHACIMRRPGGIPGMGGWFTSKKMAGGGPLIDLGVHALDLAWWLMGCPEPVSAFGVTYAKFGPQGRGGGLGGQVGRRAVKFDVEDLASGMVRFANGASIMVETSWASFIDGSGQKLLRLCGTEGGASLYPLQIQTEKHGMQMDVSPKLPAASGFEREIEHFVDCILKDREPGPSIEEGVAVMKMLDALYRSAKTGRSVSIK